jgi:predicted Zn-dependent peptidase
MKALHYILGVCMLLMTAQIHAQIDRSVRPKPGPAPKVNLGKPQVFTLPNGLKVLVVEDHKLPRVSINMTMDIDPYVLGEKAGLDGLMGAMLGKGSTKTTKDAFEEEIDFMGATLEIYESGAFASGLSRYFDRLLSMMSEAALMPNFTQEELDNERNKAIESMKTEEKSAGAIADRVRNVLVYGRNHPFGEYVTVESLNSITLEDIKAHYTKYYVPGKAYMVIMGAVKFADVKAKVTKYFAAWQKAMPPSATFPDPVNVSGTQINFIDVPNAVQAEVSFVNSVKLPMTHPDYFAVLIANEIVGGSFESYLNKTLREEKAWTYGARSSLNANKHVTTFRAGAPLKQAVLDSAILEIIKQIDRIRNEFVSTDDLELAKATFIGDFIRESAKPRSISSFALRIETQGLPANFYEKYLENISKVTIDDVKRVANKYFMTGNARIVVAAKGSEVIDKIESIGLPVFYFDRWGNPIAKPSSAVIPDGFTAQTVLERYIKAIGGMDAAKAVRTMKYIGTTNFTGAPMEIEVLMAYSIGHSLIQMNMGAMSLMKQVVTPKMGYVSQQGQKIAIEGDELTEAQGNADPIKEINLLSKSSIQLVGIEKVDEEDAYVLQDGKKKYYYSVKTGLKLAESTDFERNGEAGVAFTYYLDYRGVNGVLIPHNIIQDIGIELNIKISEVLINAGVSETDFE